MTLFPLHTTESAPHRSRDLLDATEKARGTVPNLFRVLAESPTALKAYMTLSEIFSHGDFSPAEQQLLLLAISREAGCAYCVAAHTMGGRRAKLADDAIAAVRDGRPIGDDRLDALRRFAETVVRQRGWVTPSDIKALTDRGYTKGHAIEVLVAVSLKTLSNYLNHFAETPLDGFMAESRWEPAAAAE